MLSGALGFNLVAACVLRGSPPLYTRRHHIAGAEPARLHGTRTASLHGPATPEKVMPVFYDVEPGLQQLLADVARNVTQLMTLENLCDRSLVSIDSFGYLRLHDQLRDMGRALVKAEADTPSLRSRIWASDEQLAVLRDMVESGQGSSTVQAMSLAGAELVNPSFTGCPKLRLLPLGNVQLIDSISGPGAAGVP
ncbi:hypothetical protein WJX72_000325 [[Myrmecia] bisecta]|uniref:Disease resistance protein Roq1-like winged-helix domain-containing protein n=1 Tax=[Myrmecia] bisecta TaxID=41462 RepID=A0AAW1PAV6_9CHLO